MRIAVSVETNNELESVVAHHFGRCPFFAIIDIQHWCQCDIPSSALQIEPMNFSYGYMSVS